MTNLIIAIDGYYSTGKGTFAGEIARRLGILYLDSGALYRAVTLYALQSELIRWNGEINERALQEDILMGFYCDVDGDDTIRIDEHELKYAEWTSREDIVLQPADYSLTNEMMRMFKEGKSSDFMQ